MIGNLWGNYLDQMQRKRASLQTLKGDNAAALRLIDDEIRRVELVISTKRRNAARRAESFGPDFFDAVRGQA